MKNPIPALARYKNNKTGHAQVYRDTAAGPLKRRLHMSHTYLSNSYRYRAPPLYEEPDTSSPERTQSQDSLV